ncbi:MAG: DUF3014 domain-containing protein [Steroidobacteraceae bacterium]
MTSEKPIIWGAAAVVVIAAGAFYYYYGYARHTAPVAAPKVEASASASSSSSAPAIEHPVPQAGAGGAATPPLPALNDSDKPISTALLAVPGAGGLAKLLIPQDFVRHVVATVDNLPRKKVAVQVRPIAPTAGAFVAAGTPGQLTLSPDNFARYAPFVDLVKAIDTKALVAVYFHFYPLFQQAYEDLGYPTEYFNDRVIQVIDHLLQTPDVQGPISLTQPNVMYQYADPQLEALSAGQKTLIRMGTANEDVIKAKLREIRQLIATQPPSGQASPAEAPPGQSPPAQPPSSPASQTPAPAH